MLAIGDTEAYWATIAQIGIVIALTAVIESRFALHSWSASTPIKLRKIEAVALASTTALVIAVVIMSTTVLSVGLYDAWQVYAASWGLGAGIGVTVAGPMIRIVWAAYAREVVGSLRRGEATKIGNALASVERIAAEHLEAQLGHVALMVDLHANAVERLKKAHTDGLEAAAIAILESDVRDRKEGVERAQSGLSASNNLFDEAESLSERVKAATEETNKAAADVIVQEQKAYSSPTP